MLSNFVLLGFVFLEPFQINEAHLKSPESFLAKAIDAHGGRERLLKSLSISTKGKGTMFPDGNKKLSFDSESWYHFPEKKKSILRIKEKEGVSEHVHAIDGNKGWQSVLVQPEMENRCVRVSE